jgi:hypothetical protein
MRPGTRVCTLNNGIALVDQFGNAGSDTALRVYRLDGVLAGETVSCKLSGGSGNSDLYVRTGRAPHPLSTQNSCQSTSLSSNEKCITPILKTDRSVFVAVHAVTSYNGVSLSCSRDASSCKALSQVCKKARNCCGSKSACDGLAVRGAIKTCQQGRTRGRKCSRTSQCVPGLACRNGRCLVANM